MSVARALQNVDILYAICEELAPESYTRAYRYRRRRDLASVARVSHTFSNSAIPVLWRVLLGVGPVLGLIPHVAVSFYRHGTNHSWTSYKQFVS